MAGQLQSRHAARNPGHAMRRSDEVRTARAAAAGIDYEKVKELDALAAKIGEIADACA